MSVAGTIEQLAGELAQIFEPLARRLEDDTIESLLESLGLRSSDAVSGSADLASALEAAATAASSMADLIAELTRAIAQEDALTVARASAALIELITRIVRAARDAAQALQNLSTTAAGLTPQQKAELGSFAASFVQRLLNHLIVEYIEKRYPQLALALIATGGIEIAEEPGGAVESLNGAYTRKVFHFDRTAKLFTDPSGLLREVYGWGQAGFDAIALFVVLKNLLQRRFDIPAEILQPPGEPPLLEAFGFNAELNNTFSPPGVDLTLRFPGDLSRSETITAADWQITVTTGAAFAADLTATIRPLFDLELDLPTGSADVRLAVEASRSNTAPAFLIVGTAAGSRMEVQSPKAQVQLTAHFDTANRRVAIEPEIKGSLHGGKLVINGEGADSFIGKLLSGLNIESNFDVDLAWSPSRGLVFAGSAALEIAIPTHVSLGPLEILVLYLRAGLAADGSIPVELSGGFAAALGPLKASVDRLGLTANFAFPQQGGNVGPADVTFAFKPPNGVGLSLDAGIIKGGGYLFIDPDRGEYAGALELAFSEFINLKAIGIITTRMPDGSQGFSLLILITAEFGNGLQLGFGFTLLGVGGLLGLNRTMNFQALLEGVRTGAVESIMFPRDVIANAPKIISDLRAFFPPREGIFLIGPLAKLGWGTPTLVSVSLGIIIEIPGNIALLGVLKVAIPADDVELIVLQVNFVGAIEFDKKRVYFFAALFESRVVFLTIDGEMGLLVAFGDDANFVISVGGFHPRFSPPPLPFPSPRRISLSLLNTPVSRLRIEGYFAVTSNTAQFGARVEVFFGLDILNVQGHLAFDALFQFSPFYFVIEISASLSVKVFGVGAFSVRVRGSLEGPAPWHVKGHGSISLLFWDIGVDFETTWGESRDTQLPPIAVLPLFQIEIDKIENWRALLPQGNNLLVSLRKIPVEETALVLHPLGTLRISQRALPLEIKLDKVGAQKPSDVNRLSLTVVGGGLAKKDDAFEPFAPAQFQNFSDADKLSKPAFAPERSGLDLSAAGVEMRSSVMVKRIVRYEEIIIDSNFKRFQRRFRDYFGALFNFFLNGAAVTRSDLSKAVRSKYKPFEEKISVRAETYTVAFQSNNKAFAAEATSFQSETSARDYMARKIAEDPTLTDSIHVIPSYEEAA